MAKETETRRTEKKPKRKLDALGITLRVLLVVAAGLFILLAVLSWPSIRENGFYDTFFGSDEDEHEIVRAEELTFAANTKNVFAAYRDGIAILGPSGLQVIDPSGETVLDEAKSFNRPVLRSDGDFLLAYDAGGTNMLCAEDGAVVTSDTSETPIISAEINRAGWRVIISEGSGWKAVATVLDDKNEKVYELSSAERYLVGGDVSPDCTRTALAGIRQSDAQIISSVYIFEHTSEEPIAFWESSSGVILSVEFLDDGSILAICENMAVFLDGDTGAELGRFTFSSGSLGSFAVGDDFVAFATAADSGGESARVTTCDFFGSEMARTTIGGVIDLDAEEDFLGVLTSGSILVYNSVLGSVAEGASTTGSRTVLMAERDTAYLITANTASVYEY